MATLCNLDGAIVAEADARVPVLDRGFLFGDSIYEVVRTRGGVPFAFDEHFERLEASARGLGMELDLSPQELVRRIDATMTAAGNPESYVRIIVTRGTGTAPNIDLSYAPGPLRWVLMVRPLGAPAGDVRLALVDRLRNDRRALDPAVKSGNYLNNVLGLREAREIGATDCVFLNAAGHVTEASTSNLFVVRGGTIATPRLDDGILAGVTRALLLAFCRDRGDRVEERHLAAEDLRSADEAFLTSTLRDVAPVTHLDGAPIGGHQEFARRLQSEFSAFADERARTLDGPRWRQWIAH